MANKKLIVPIYLNQKIVFDLLAIVEDGFSQMKNIQKTSSGETDISSDINGEIGTSNIFAFLSVKMKATVAGNKKASDSKVMSEERIHTPTSLFSRLLEYLETEKLVKLISETTDLKDVSPGDFVILNGTLEKNPIISFMDSFVRMMELAVVFDDGSNKQQSKGKKSNKHKGKDSNEIIFDQMKSMSETLKVGGMIDLLCKISNNKNIVAVLQTWFNPKKVLFKK